MKTKSEDMERAYSVTVFGSLILGVLVLAASLVFLIFGELLGSSAMKNPHAQELLHRILRLLLLGMFPTLGVAFIGVSRFMRQYRKLVRCEYAA